MIWARTRLAVRVLRAPFFTAVIVPVVLGGAVASYEGRFHLSYWLLALLGAVSVNAALNLSNDYFDHLSGDDEVNQELTPFSGGSRIIQDGVLTPRQVLGLSLSFYLVVILIGLYLAITRGWLMLGIGLLGIALAFGHNVPRWGLYYLAPGVGEFGVAVGCGPLIVLGAYYAQAQRLSSGALWAALPVGLLIAAVLYINEFPDYAADKAVGKRTIVAVLGRARAVPGYAALLIGAYLLVLLGVVLGALPAPTLLALLTVPWARRGIQGARRFHGDTPRLLSVNAVTIQLHLVTGLLLSLGYLIAGAV